MSDTVTQSESYDVDSRFIEDDFLRVDGGGIITEISKVKRRKSTVTNKIKLYVDQPESAGPWNYKYDDVVNWDEESCWLVKLAKERGVDLEHLSNLEGEEVYIHRKDDDTGWFMNSEDPREMFDEDEIGVNATVENRSTETLESVSDDSEDQDVDIEKECLEYERVGDYFRCEVVELNEVNREGQCNLIEISVDTPYDKGKWGFKKPYGWCSENPLVKIAEERSYGEGNFTEIVGDDVLVKRVDDQWELSLSDPESEDSTNSNEENSHWISSISNKKGLVTSFLTILFAVISLLSYFMFL